MSNEYHSGVPPPVFFVRCEIQCGKYPISEATAREFLSPQLKLKLDEALKKGAHGAILTFPNGCPRCTPRSAASIIKLSALQPRLH